MAVTLWDTPTDARMEMGSLSENPERNVVGGTGPDIFVETRIHQMGFAGRTGSNSRELSYIGLSGAERGS